MNVFTRSLLAASALTAIGAFQLPAALADDATATPAAADNAANVDASAKLGISAVDAGKLIGENVYDANGDTVGEIDSVIVDTKGKVTSVVLDVGGWLSADKQISVPWKDLKSDADGKITSSLTKQQAEAAAGYSYKDKSWRGKILGESGEPYDVNGQATTQAAAANNGSDGTMSVGTPVHNADGSYNASEVIGLDVRNSAEDSIGKISQLVLDKSGSVAGVVVDVGGFLGIGAHPVLLQWKQVKLTDRDGKTEAVVSVDKETLKQMPAYKS